MEVTVPPLPSRRFLCFPCPNYPSMVCHNDLSPSLERGRVYGGEGEWRGEREDERVMRCKWSLSHCHVACSSSYLSPTFFVLYAWRLSRGFTFAAWGSCLHFEIERIPRLCIIWIAGALLLPQIQCESSPPAPPLPLCDPIFPFCPLGFGCTPDPTPFPHLYPQPRSTFPLFAPFVSDLSYFPFLSTSSSPPISPTLGSSDKNPKIMFEYSTF